MYAVVDIETTGGSPVSEKITEIAIYHYDGKTITDEYVTLINPERQIPYYITQLTGITNSMVESAPRFFEVARKIVEMTQDRIFVAHNVNFDYNFIKQEFKTLGYNFQCEKLCTVNLSRKVFPGHKSYSLGKICDALGIEINGRHRAAGDAFATVKLLEHLIKKSPPEKIHDFQGVQSLKDLHPNLDPAFIKQIPDEAGVYYFYNDKNDLIYFGKSKSLHSRIISHFRNISTKKAFEMRNAIASVDYETTGCDLVAQLRESTEIKQHKPIYNKAQRRSVSIFGLYSYTDENQYIRFEIGKNSSRNQIPLCSFSSLKSGKLYLQKLVDKYSLCQKLCGLYATSGSCFHYEIMECKGACIGKELPESYNKRANQIILEHTNRFDSFIIIEHGRQASELSAIVVQNGKYKGYGFFDRENLGNNLEIIFDCIKKQDDNRDIQQIIRNYLRTSSPIDIIRI